jgi:hypothetical protein
MPRRVYYFPLDEKLQERFPALPIELLPDGTADVSKLPPELQDQLLTFGVQDPTHTITVYPKDGELFLDSLLESNDLYRRFRSDPESR